MIIPFQAVGNIFNRLRLPIDLKPTTKVRPRDVLREFNALPITAAKRLAGGVLLQPKKPTPKTFKLAVKQYPKEFKAVRQKRKDEFKALPPEKQLEQFGQNVIGLAPVGGLTKSVKPIVTQTAKKGFQRLERGFVTSAREVVPKAEKIAGQYVPRSTNRLAVKAKNFVKDNVTAAERFAMKGTTDKAVAVASELIKKYGDDATRANPAQAQMLYDKAAEIANSMAIRLTEAGRTVQAASIVGRLTPEGQLRFAARQIQKFNESTLGRKIPELTGQQAGFITNEMRAIQEMPNGFEKAARFQKLQNYITDLVPTPVVKKIATVWKAGLLTGVKTSGLNLFSNLSHSATEIAKDVPAAIADSAASLFTGQRTKTFTLRGQGKGMREGFQKGVRYLRTGFDERNIGQKLDYNRVNFGKGPVAKIFKAYTETVFKAIGTPDQPFYYGALSRSLMDQALAIGKTQGLRGRELKQFASKLVQNPTEDMIKYGVADAATAVFQNKTKLGDVAKAIQRAPLGEFVVPFARTPSAVAIQILKYTPAGVAGEIFSQAANRKFNQRLFSEAIGRGLTGTGVLSLGYLLGKKGMIALDRPTNEREQKLWELEGRKPNSIKIGNKWRGANVLGPAGNLLLIGGHFFKALQESGSPTEALSKALAGSAKSFSEQTFLTGINQAVTAIIDPGRSAQAYFNNLVGSVVPTLASDVARAMDPLERRTETAVQRIKSRIPKVREQLQPQVNVLGEEIESIGNPLEILADPSRPSKEKTGPVVSELRRLTDSGYAVSPTLLGDKKGFDALTPEQNTELWKRSGEITSKKLEALFNHPKYQILTDEDKAKVVEMFIDKSKVSARAELAVQLTEGLNGDELKKRLGELKRGGLLTKEVFNLYVDIR